MASENISFDSIPASIRKPGKYFEFNTKLAVRTLPANVQRVLLIGQRLKACVEPRRWQGGTLNDLTSGGTYTGTVKNDYQVKISTAAAADKFKWSKDEGVTWSEEVTITGAAQALELGVTVTFAATTGHAVDDEWRFGAWPEPSVAEAVATQVFSDAEAQGYFGAGSMLHRMVRAAIQANPYLDLTCIALDDADAAVAATGTATLANNAGSAGVITLWIGNQKVEVAVASGDTPTAMATALVEEIAQASDLPVKASNLAGVITLTAKNKGICGNQVGLDYTLTNVIATTVTIVAMASGATNPDPQDALDIAFPEEYTIIVTPYNNADDLTTLRDHLDSVSGPLEQRGAVGVYATTDTLAAATTLAGQVNHGRIAHAYVRGTRSLPMEVAAAFGSVMASEEDPARPLNTLELKKIHAPTVENRLSRSEQESLLHNGVAPMEVGPGERVQIVRAITTYVKDAQGIDDISLLDVTTIRTLDYVRKACRERISLRFPREKLSSKTPPRVRSELLDVLLALQDLEIIEEVEANLDGLIVERDLQDPNRLDAKIPTDVVNGLHVFAGRIDLLL